MKLLSERILELFVLEIRGAIDLLIKAKIRDISK
jgi:hypothetical protein